VQILRASYYVKDKGSVYPLDESLAITGLEVSEGLQHEIGYISALMPHRECSKFIERYFKQAVSHVTCQKTSNEVHQKSKLLEVRKLNIPKNKSEQRITFLVDGGRARTRIDKKPAKFLKFINLLITKDGGKLISECFSERRKQELTNEINPWRETKTWVITNGSDTVQRTTISDHKEFMDDFCSCIIKCQVSIK
jgi:hypothetical protein